MKRCLLTNPIANGSLLAKALVARGVECYAIIEMDKVALIEGLNKAKKDEFDTSYYRDIFLDTAKVPENIEFDAIIPGSEHGVYLADVLASRYGLPGNPPLTSHRRRCKDAMQQALSEAGLNNMASISITEESDIDAILTGWTQFPCIVKPQSAAGCEGVNLCSTQDQLEQVIAELPWGSFSTTWTYNDTFLLQPFIAGDEYVVDLVATENGYVTSAVCRYIRGDELGIADSPFVKKFSLMLPIDTAKSLALIDYAKAAAAALDIQIGPVHMEIIDSQNGPVMVEAGARLHGTIAPALLERCYQNTVFDQIYECYFSEKKEQLQDAIFIRPGIVTDILSVRSGVFPVARVELANKLKKFPGFIDAIILLDQGERYELTSTLIASPLSACFSDDNISVLSQSVERFDNAMQDFLDNVILSRKNWRNINDIYQALLH
jgi:Biotin carboxylase